MSGIHFKLCFSSCSFSCQYSQVFSGDTTEDNLMLLVDDDLGETMEKLIFLMFGIKWGGGKNSQKLTRAMKDDKN